jgi:alkaline phosphatase
MKLRNLLLALFGLLAFIGFGVFYFRTWVVQKPFGIILFIGDGLTPGTLEAARIYGGGAANRLGVEKFPNMALLRNYSNDYAVPDSPAAATALAAGAKVNNRSIGIDPQGNELQSLLDLAIRAGRKVGLVTNGNLTDAGLAAFYGRTKDGREQDNLAIQLMEHGNIDVILGGGSHHFLPEAKGGLRKDGRDLLVEMKERGREIVQSREQLENATSFRTSSILGFFADESLPWSNRIESGSTQPSLSDMVRRAIQFMQFNQQGYLLIVDAELITRAQEQNEAEQALVETLDLDRAIATAMEYAGDKALIIATGKHATGGLALNGYPLRQDSKIALLGTNPFGYPSFTWATGPKGPKPQEKNPPAATSGTGAATNGAESEAGRVQTEPAAFYAPSGINTASDVIAVGRGPGSEKLRGFMENTKVFEILKEKL